MLARLLFSCVVWSWRICLPLVFVAVSIESFPKFSSGDVPSSDSFFLRLVLHEVITFSYNPWDFSLPLELTPPVDFF